MVARSTTEAEARAMTLAICEVLWLKKLLKDLGIKTDQPIPVKCDNKVKLAIAANPVHHDKMKHVDIVFNFIKDHSSKGTIAPQYVCFVN